MASRRTRGTTLISRLVCHSAAIHCICGEFDFMLRNDYQISLVTLHSVQCNNLHEAQVTNTDMINYSSYVP